MASAISRTGLSPLLRMRRISRRLASPRASNPRSLAGVPEAAASGTARAAPLDPLPHRPNPRSMVTFELPQQFSYRYEMPAPQRDYRRPRSEARRRSSTASVMIWAYSS